MRKLRPGGPASQLPSGMGAQGAAGAQSCPSPSSPLLPSGAQVAPGPAPGGGQPVTHPLSQAAQPSHPRREAAARVAIGIQGQRWPEGGVLGQLPWLMDGQDAHGQPGPGAATPLRSLHLLVRPDRL